MSPDPVVAEIHRVREVLAARFGYDLTAIANYARERDAVDDRQVIRRPPRRPIVPAPAKPGPHMTEIHVTRELQSDTLQLPELRPLIGKTVEIIVRDVTPQTSQVSPWDALQALAGQDLVDPSAYRQLRDLDVQQQGG
jgi:hypothetical protein